MHKRNISDQRGASMIEYVTALAILLPIFIAFAFGLEAAIKSQTLTSRATVKTMTPKSSGLAALRDGDQEALRLDKTSRDEHN